MKRNCPRNQEASHRPQVLFNWGTTLPGAGQTLPDLHKEAGSSTAWSQRDPETPTPGRPPKRSEWFDQNCPPAYQGLGGRGPGWRRATEEPPHFAAPGTAGSRRPANQRIRFALPVRAPPRPGSPA
ncbi:uncharacterized protein LOC143690782 [Tamandua tetradactyla]|uniref:uncharacterized protein LOC143690782 n=1 Tax=Tamandua tetradactyla TaxID=48850 RepID=UPI004053946B